MLSKILSSFGVHLNDYLDVSSFLIQAWSKHFSPLKHFSPQILALWKVAVVTYFWAIWSIHNQALFDEVLKPKESMVAMFWAFDGGDEQGK